jgi:hypothetical protein
VCTVSSVSARAHARRRAVCPPRFLSFVRPSPWRRSRRTIRDSTHSAWKRSRTPEAQLEARRKWGAPCCGENGPGRGLCRLRCPRYRRACVRILTGVEVLGARSLRDEYLLSRARALSRAAHISVSYDIARWLRQPGLRQAPSNRAAGAKTSQETAGVSTPVSSRSRKKKSRGGIGGQAT